MQKLILKILLITFGIVLHAQPTQQILDFEFEGVKLNGVLNLPTGKPVKGIVLIVHGSGRTNAVAQNWYGDVRNSIQKAGYGTYMWDKMGCGSSEGIFNYNQTVENSGQEVIAAINQLRKLGIPASDKIGLWGISRAGWINPIVIHKFKDIQFWISVSGVDGKESFPYLFENNLKINGVPQDSVQLLVDELKKGYRITHTGQSYETYLAATQNLHKNHFLNRFNNGRSIHAEGYYTYQKTFVKEAFDQKTNLQIYIPDFDSLLNRVGCPVLAIFGEKDKHVDWQKTKALYEQTLGKHTALTIRSFPDANHNLYQCKTGGFYEFQDNKLPWDRPPGFLEAIEKWLEAIE